ncbi:MAG: hypothetical protein Q8Q42_03650 [Nanoarchaeota archaeon]|nr:hypothetical protein [Nanoarchaeota archaeon]
MSDFNVKQEVYPQNNTIHNLVNRVLDFIRINGPSVPVAISQGVGRDSFFVGAILSDLIQSKKVSLSHAKIGGSKVYYLPGQEEKLSILYKYLQDAEKKAYDLLKENGVVKSSETTPVMRVALANITDFSVPIIINGENSWRWYLYKEEIKPEVYKEEIKPEIEKIKLEAQQTISQEQGIKIQKSKTPKEDTFSKQIEDFFASSGIKIQSKEIIRKNSESNFTIVLTTQIGPIEMFVCAKNKKKISDQDIMVAHQKAQNRKLPALFITTGDQSKKAKEYLEKNLKGYMLFRKI